MENLESSQQPPELLLQKALARYQKTLSLTLQILGDTEKDLLSSEERSHLLHGEKTRIRAAMEHLEANPNIENPEEILQALEELYHAIQKRQEVFLDDISSGEAEIERLTSQVKQFESLRAQVLAFLENHNRTGGFSPQ